MIDASRDRAADKVLAALPHRYLTQVDPAGCQLNHRRRQLVGLKLGYLDDPALLVLGEATSAVEVGTESRIQAALRWLCKGRTALIIAYRLATICDANRMR